MSWDYENYYFNNEGWFVYGHAFAKMYAFAKGGERFVHDGI